MTTTQLCSAQLRVPLSEAEMAAVTAAAKAANVSAASFTRVALRAALGAVEQPVGE